jgi:methylated-DNA-[protein]-cysteine S-methyltransferase
MENAGDICNMSMIRLSVDTLESPIGTLQLRFDRDGLHAVAVSEHAGTDTGTRSQRYPHRDAFAHYFEGDLDALTEVPIVPLGSAFQIRVWGELRKIPPGRTLSYAQLARRIGNPAASRAVGSANARNPLCIVVPCHRVISADGSLGGFSAGLEAKRWLLRHEGAAFKA